jgi:hypothetical protein
MLEWRPACAGPGERLERHEQPREQPDMQPVCESS